MAYYQSLHEYLETLDKKGLLVKITKSINKDTQLAPLVRLQYRGLPDEQRKAFLFTNVFDSRGKKYDIPVAMGALGGSSSIYAMGLQCQPKEIAEKVAQAQLHPIEPRLVKQGPVQDVVYMGDRLLEKGGLDELPVPIATPGYDAGPITSASNWITKDIETGVRNVGRYRSQLYAQDRMGIHWGQTDQGGQIHWQKCRARGIPLQAAIVFGGPPNLSYVASSNFPYGVDEYSVAGGIAGEAVELVKCKTVDLEVPANADIVIEGELTTEELEMEAPHGEFQGYMGMEEMQPYFTVKCITHCKDPIYLAHISQLPPSERGMVNTLYKYLKYDLNISSVLQTGFAELETGHSSLIIIKMKTNTDQKEVWRALEAAAESSPFIHTIVAVDEDIDSRSPDMVWWAIGTRAQPHRDFRIIKRISTDVTDYSLLPGEELTKVRYQQFDPDVNLPERSTLLMNATIKWTYPPVCLPKKEFMEGALAIWRELNLPMLKLKKPWYSYEMGYWTKESAENAQRAVEGEYYQTSEMRATKRVKLQKISPSQVKKFG